LPTSLGTFNALRIEPSIVLISDNSYRKQATGMTIWVSDDRRHLPLRAEAAIFFGSVDTDLVQVIEPQEKHAEMSAPDQSR
jgi:hypothetical protein